jgi:hypothetical protein
MTGYRTLRSGAALLLAGLSLLLSGCLITPGKFTSELILIEGNRFTFTYEGEIFFLGLSNLAQMGAAGETFKFESCFDEETYEDRECTQEELETQRADWQAGAEFRAAEAAQQAEQMSAMMGGIDPNDPEAAAELTGLLLRQEGWTRVVSKGDGVFDVTYSVSGELSHDFMFPVIEDFPMVNPFVQLILRDGGVVRVNAPGFATQNETSPVSSMMGRMSGFAGLNAIGNENAGAGDMPDMPVIQGTFTIITSGSIRTNNTDEGPAPTAGGERLVWEISPRTSAAPTALIDMSR